MPELRHDPLSGCTVIVAPERGARPHSSRAQTVSTREPRDCPFCRGHEAMTPPEVYRTGPGPPDGPGWRVRVVPNLYPIVAATSVAPDGIGATGAHEVVVLSPDHQRSFARLGDEEASEVLAVLRDRARAQLAEGRRYAQMLINQGREAGASLAHPHAQLVALDFVPPGVEDALARFAAAGTDLVRTEIDAATAGPFGVLDGAAPAWCPPASSYPFQFRVAHRDARARFEEASDDEIAAVASSLRAMLARFDGAVGDAPYNVVMHTAPPRVHPDEFHWYLDVLPRLSVIAGFEHGTGVLVNTDAPETAAARLRAG